MEFIEGMYYKNLVSGDVIRYLGFGHGWYGLMNCWLVRDNDYGYVDIESLDKWKLLKNG